MKTFLKQNWEYLLWGFFMGLCMYGIQMYYNSGNTDALIGEVMQILLAGIIMAQIHYNKLSDKIIKNQELLLNDYRKFYKKVQELANSK